MAVPGVMAVSVAWARWEALCRARNVQLQRSPLRFRVVAVVEVAMAALAAEAAEAAVEAALASGSPAAGALLQTRWRYVLRTPLRLASRAQLVGAAAVR